jgi:ATP-binding cassette subfamily B protein
VSRGNPEPRGWVRRLFGYLLAHRTNFILSVGAAVLGSAGQSIVPLITRQILDKVIIAKTSPLWPWLLLLLAVAAMIFALAYVRRYRGGRLALEVQYDLRNAMHERLQQMDLATLSGMPTGQLVSRAISDSTLVQGLLNLFPIMSGNVLLVVASLAAMFYLAPLLAIVSVLVIPALMIVSYRMRSKIFPAAWDGQQREGDIAGIVDEDVNGVRVVKAFGQEQRELRRLVDAARTLYGSKMRVVRLQARYQPFLNMIPSLAQVTILAFGGWLALRGQISIGTFLAFATYVAQFVTPSRLLAGLLTVGQRARAGAERIFALLDLEPAIADPPGAVVLPPLRGEIVLRDVHFGYSGGAPVLRGLDLAIAPGERVALVGPSGSGKSTAAALLTRSYDVDEGSVQIDGHDVREVNLASLRSQIGVAFEESFLFTDSVRANIAYGRPDASDAEIEAAARAAQAHEFILALPRGYDTTVGERGLTLSGGQRQRIALARTILTDPQILILDDATSAVDARTEEAIHDELRELLAERTTLLIAHRRSTLHLADRVVLLEDGRATDQGTHEELAERNPRYRALLTGLDEELAEQADGRVESLAALSASGQVTEAAWTAVQHNGANGTGPRRAVSAAPASLGAGLGGRSGWGGIQLAPTPELLAQVEKLPPVRDVATVDIAGESRRSEGFTLFRLLAEFRRPLLLALIFVVLDAIATLAGPVLVKVGLDDGVAQGSDRLLFTAAGVFLVVTIADMLVQICQTYVSGRAAQRIMLSLRVRIWAQLQRLSMDYYEREMAGRIMTRMTTDVDQFEQLIQQGLLAALVSIVTFVGVGVALLVINFELALCTLAVVPPLVVATIFFRRRAVRLYDTARDRVAIVNADFQESLSGVRESQAFVHEAATIARFHRLGHSYLETRVAAQRLVATYFPFVQFLSIAADAIVLGVGAEMVAAGRLSTGALIAFLLYITMFFSPIQQLSQVFDSWQQTRVSVGRIAELMSFEPITKTAEHPIVPGRLIGELDVDEAHFSYPTPPDRPFIHGRGPADARLMHSPDALRSKPPEALRGVDLDAGAGETIALVGETGAGKSTVMKLLARFYDPDQGAVRADGHDLRSLELAAFRAQLGYVPQEPFLFTGSIRDNIAYGRPEASDAEVEAAARAVGAHDFIATLAGGYTHELAERGKSLSAGQRQLIALARAELVDPALLLLDEATANLDLVTEARVAAAMARVAHQRTTVLIAHRLQTARTADRIAVLDHGTVVEIGSHDELLAAGGRYAAMWRAFDLIGAGRD